LTTVRRFVWLCFLLGSPRVLNTVSFLTVLTYLLDVTTQHIDTEISFVASHNMRHTVTLLAPVGDTLSVGKDGGFCGDEDGGDDDVSSFGSEPSRVESGAVSAVTASFV
jgi:hypothetical protein